MNILIGILGCFAANYIFVICCYDQNINQSAIKTYIYCGLAALLSVYTWLYLVRSASSEREIFIINFTWDVAVIIFWFIMTLVVYKIKLDIMTLIGIIIAIIGILITKVNSHQ